LNEMQLSQSFYAGGGLFFWFWLPEQVVSSGKGALSGSLGEQRACRRPAPASECWPEESRYPEGRTSAKPRRPEVTFPWDRQLRQGPSSPAENASAGERVAPRRTACVPATNSGERMLAGGESLSGGRTSAKPRRPEVTFSWDCQLRQGPPSPAENASAGERVAPRRTACVPATNSGERMLAGGQALSGGRTSAKPRKPEVTVYRDLHLRRELPSPDQVRSLE
jgi:hypothetical protein